MIRLVCIVYLALETIAQPIDMVYDQQLVSSNVDESDIERYKNLILEENMKKIQEHNSRPRIKYKMKMNSFGSLNQK